MSAPKSAASAALSAALSQPNLYNGLEVGSAAPSAAPDPVPLPIRNKNPFDTNDIQGDITKQCRTVPHIPLNPLTCAHTHTRTHARAVGPLKENAALCGTATLSVQKCNLLDLAQRVARLGPDRRNPEQFHIDKSEIVAELRRLARRKAVTP